MIGVYTIRHTASGCFYFGSSEDYTRRQKHHLYQLKRGDHGNKTLQELYIHSPELTWEFTPCDSREEAYQLEERCIREHWGNPKLCNIAFGKSGWHAGTMPDDVRQRIAATKTGSSHTEETKLLMSAQRRGKKKSTEWVNKIAEASRLQVQVGDVVYSGCKAAAQAFGICTDTVRQRVRSTSKKFGNWSVVQK